VSFSVDTPGRRQPTRELSVAIYLLLLICAVVVPLLAFSAFVLGRHVVYERERIAERAVEMARDAALLVDSELMSFVSLLRGLSTSGALRNEELAQFHEEASRLVAGQDRLVVLRSFGPKQIFNTQRPFAAELPPAVDISPAEAARLREGLAVVSPVYNSPISGEPRVALAIAVTSGRGTEFVLAITVPTTVLREALPKTQPGWVIGVGDPQSGRFVTRSSRHRESSGLPASAAYFSAAADRGGGSFTATSFDGVQVLAGYAYGSFSNWLFAVNVPSSIVEMPLRRSMYAFAVLGAIALCLSLALAWGFGRYFSRESLQIVARARQLGGDNARAQPPSAIREFNRIGEALAVTERELKAREEQRQRLVAELNHRVKNMLTIVQSLLTNTIRHAGSLDDARRSFTKRLRALAAAHDILTSGNWGAPDLQELLARVTEPYNLKGQIGLEGPSVRAEPATAISVALAINELATNAVKYGALSLDEGSVSIRWARVERDGRFFLELVWQERRGPAVATPATAGFGTRLLRDSFAGRATTQYLAEGLRWTVTLQFDEDGAATMHAAADAQPQNGAAASAI